MEEAPTRPSVRAGAARPHGGAHAGDDGTRRPGGPGPAGDRRGGGTRRGSRHRGPARYRIDPRGRLPPAPDGVRRTAPARAGRSRSRSTTARDASTEAILRILAEKQVRATFFDIGINETVHPATVRAIAAQGHLLGDHLVATPTCRSATPPRRPRRWTTPRPSRRHRGRAVLLLPPALRRLRPHDPRPRPRPPDGRLQLVGRHPRLGGRGSGATRWVDRIVTRAEAGGRQTHPVVLMHDSPAGNPATVAALPAIIDFYRAAGYTFVDLAGWDRAAGQPVDRRRSDADRAPRFLPRHELTDPPCAHEADPLHPDHGGGEAVRSGTPIDRPTAQMPGLTDRGSLRCSNASPW